MREVWRSERVVTREGVRPAAIIVEDGSILDVVETTLSDFVTHDYGTDALLPGLVDAHVHINEPGRTEWEGFESATRAAAAGGFTTLIDMPLNCLPETTTVAALEQKRSAASGKCFVDWAAWGGAVGFGDKGGNEEDLLPLATAGVAGYKCFLIYPGCDGLTMIDTAQLERSLPKIAASGLPLLVHAELAAPMDAAVESLTRAGADWRKFSTYLTSRPDEAELSAINLLIHLCRRYQFKLHIVHLATAHAFDALRKAKEEGLPITVETCPHYLHLAAEDIPDGATQFKCAPPIRNRCNRELLWEGLRSGVIDMVATDHSPCPPEMKRTKEGRFDLAWGGIASLSTALSVMWSEAQQRGFRLEDIVRWMSSFPSKMVGLEQRVGAIASGYDANFIRFDPEAEFVVTEENLYYRHKISPYMGERLRGRVKATVLRGSEVYREGEFSQPRRGKEYNFFRQPA